MVGQERLRVWIKMCSLEHVKEARKDVKGCSVREGGRGGWVVEEVWGYICGCLLPSL